MTHRRQGPGIRQWLPLATDPQEQLADGSPGSSGDEPGERTLSRITPLLAARSLWAAYESICLVNRLAQVNGHGRGHALAGACRRCRKRHGGLMCPVVHRGSAPAEFLRVY